MEGEIDVVIMTCTGTERGENRMCGKIRLGRRGRALSSWAVIGISNHFFVFLENSGSKSVKRDLHDYILISILRNFTLCLRTHYNKVIGSTVKKFTRVHVYFTVCESVRCNPVTLSTFMYVHKQNIICSR